MNTHQIPDSITKRLICPFCGGQLVRNELQITCKKCNESYPISATGQIDLRLRSEKQSSVTFSLGQSPLPEPGEELWKPLGLHPSPAIDMSSLHIPWHLTKTLVSHFPKPQTAQSLMLDLGSGAGIHQQIIEDLGYQWVGLDYTNPAAPILGDGHALPFEDESFEFIMSIAVLEHIQHPAVMMQEAKRVLQPGGVLIGTVSFLEPFHDNSFYHHTHLGTYTDLKQAGFNIQHIAPSPDWLALVALAEMSLFRGMPALLAKLLISPIQLLHRLWWAIGYLLTKAPRASEAYRKLTTTGAFTFIATKPLS